jgi:hypothetical protein
MRRKYEVNALAVHGQTIDMTRKTIPVKQAKGATALGYE